MPSAKDHVSVLLGLEVSDAIAELCKRLIIDSKFANSLELTGGCKCAAIQSADHSRHFRECPLRAKYPEPEKPCGECGGEGFVCDFDKSHTLLKGHVCHPLQCACDLRPCPACQKPAVERFQLVLDGALADERDSLRERVVEVEAKLAEDTLVMRGTLAYQDELSLRLESVFAQLTAAKADLATVKLQLAEALDLRAGVEAMARERAIWEAHNVARDVLGIPEHDHWHKMLQAIRALLDKKGPAT
jgi:hypothetical protein